MRGHLVGRSGVSASSHEAAEGGAEGDAAAGVGERHARPPSVGVCGEDLLRRGVPASCDCAGWACMGAQSKRSSTSGGRQPVTTCNGARTSRALRGPRDGFMTSGIRVMTALVAILASCRTVVLSIAKPVASGAGLIATHRYAHTQLRQLMALK